MSEEIRQLLEQYVQDELLYENLSDLLEAFTDNDEEAGYELGNAIIYAVEKLTSRKLLWHVELLHDDLKLSHEIYFIAVDPQSRICLTADERTIGVGFWIGSVEDAVRAVEELVETIEFGGERR